MSKPQVKIYFQDERVEELYRKAGYQDDQSSGFDLVVVENVYMLKGQLHVLNLGINVEVPHTHHSIVMPRSSTFKKFGLLQANSVGLIDSNYNGAEDIWRFPCIYMGNEEGTRIEAGSRICQFILQEKILFDVNHDFMWNNTNKNRGGFGSTGH